jgi:hypothetical protein
VLRGDRPSAPRAVVCSRFVPLDALGEPGDRHDSVVFAVKVENADALRVAADLSDVVDFAAQHFALRRHQHDFIAIPHLEKSDS